ncbi:aldo/keto reductase [uncultured Winogradskyella sp.]|uniref:aldo/keto reductase n=1 Tax=uncultured Winogradskyella sp. TaxID=395353 RepID=UPI002625EE7C|nr:aldo/keto reductase [uncultured Winogradskyella sp.]
MNKRLLGKTEFEVSEIGLGTWQLGGKWGQDFNHNNADKILNLAIDNGVNFIDTADVYNDGDSEKAIGRLIKSRSERIYVATKCGRQLSPHNDKAYQTTALRKFVEDSLMRMGLETLDLIQLHCPPTETYDRPEIFDLFDTLKKEGKILNLGVSVEKIDEAKKAITYSNVTTVQIIFNMLRQRPANDFFALAAKNNVGIIARVPLASGLLTGKFSPSTQFNKNDHRSFNRNGEMFDKGETFSGVDYNNGLKAVKEIKELFPKDVDLVKIALRWILMFKEVSCVIPGASSPAQAIANTMASAQPNLTLEQIDGIKRIYEDNIWPDIANEKW